jgi:carboxypeptidase Taq
VKPSLIRVEADELTYNLHIMLRFEIELDLIEKRIEVEDLPTVWNQKMKEYLGIVPPRDADGVLQDVHWSLGAFGYFPTYTLGTLYASMIFNQAHQEIPDLDHHLSQGNMVPLKSWLNKKIHHRGREFTPQELILHITGQPLSPEPFVQYLKVKFGELYGFSTKS